MSNNTGLLITTDTIKIIAESCGLANINDDIALLIASDVEYRLREITEEATKLMKHAKRPKLSTEDLNYGLQLFGVEALYGHSNTVQNPKYVRVPDFKDLFYLENKDIDFGTILASELPVCPKEASLDIHWMAIEGVQPDIPQNPEVIIGDTEEEKLNKKRKLEEVEDAPPVPPPKKVSFQLPPKPVASNNVEPLVVPATPHALSKELQIYFQKIEDAIAKLSNLRYSFYERKEKKDDVELKLFATIFPKRTENITPFFTAVQSLEIDPGIQKLVPYIVKLVTSVLSTNQPSLPSIRGILQITNSVFYNKNINFDTHLHQFIPLILTCILRNELSKDPFVENHWSVRDTGAHLLSQIKNRYSKQYKELEARLVKILVNILVDASKSSVTHYGAVKSLASFGHQYLTQVILPFLPKLRKRIQSRLKSQSSSFQALQVSETLFSWKGVLEIFGNYFKEALEAFEIVPPQPSFTHPKINIFSQVQNLQHIQLPKRRTDFSKTVCFFYAADGTCSKANCQFSHTTKQIPSRLATKTKPAMTVQVLRQSGLSKMTKYGEVFTSIGKKEKKKKQQPQETFQCQNEISTQYETVSEQFEFLPLLPFLGNSISELNFFL